MYRCQGLLLKSHSSCTNSTAKRGKKTYNSWDSPVVTHLTTSQPVGGLTCGEQTGSGVIPRLWSYVSELYNILLLILCWVGAEDKPETKRSCVSTTSTTPSQPALSPLRHQQEHTIPRFLRPHHHRSLLGSWLSHTLELLYRNFPAVTILPVRPLLSLPSRAASSLLAA
jgi:hypothetical protein